MKKTEGKVNELANHQFHRFKFFIFYHHELKTVQITCYAYRWQIVKRDNLFSYKPKNDQESNYLFKSGASLQAS